MNMLKTQLFCRKATKILFFAVEAESSTLVTHRVGQLWNSNQGEPEVGANNRKILLEQKTAD